MYKEENINSNSNSLGSFPFIQLFEKQIVQVKNKSGIYEIKGNQEQKTLN